jgi:hypothetical protein
MLERAGYRVLAHADGGAALVPFEVFPHRIDLLLADFIMPRMNGPSLDGASDSDHGALGRPRPTAPAVSQLPKAWTATSP